MSETVHLDCRRLLCPMPVIKTQNAIKSMMTGDQLIATCTDPGVKHDLPAWCRVNGHEIASIEEIDREIIISIIVHA